MKMIKVDEETHASLMELSKKMKLSINLVIKALLAVATGLSIGCSTPRYYESKIPEFSYDQIDHQQKVKTGITKEEFFKKFGRPNIIRNGVSDLSTYQPVIVAEYYYAIFCDQEHGGTCRIYFDPRTGAVVKYANFRMEYTEDLK